MATTRSTAPFEYIFMDFIGPFRDCTPKGDSHTYKHIVTIIDRFSHFVVREPTEDTSAHTVAKILFNSWICCFGIPKLLTSDGGSPFASTTMAEVARLLQFEHHISAPYHPDGHEAVERANYTITQTIRALFRGCHYWSDLVRPTAFVINTSYSRAIGTTPLAIVHGFPPRLPLYAALELLVSLEIIEDDPVAFAQSLITATTGIYKRVAEIQKKLYEADLKEVRAHAKGQTTFKPGDHVLIHYPRPEKLLLE